MGVGIPSASFVSHSPSVSRHPPCWSIHGHSPSQPLLWSVRVVLAPWGPANKQGHPDRCPGAAGRGSKGLCFQERLSPTFPVSTKEGEGFRLEPTGGRSWPVPNSGLNKVIWGPGKLAPSDLGFFSTEFCRKSAKVWLCSILLCAVLLGFYR